MKKWLRNLYMIFLYRMQLSTKLLLSYAVLIIIPLLSLTLLSYSHVSGTLIRQFRHSMDLSLQQTGTYLDRILCDIINATQQAAYHNTLTDLYRKNAPSNQLLALHQDYRTAYDLLNGIFSSDDFYSAEIFTTGKFVFAKSKGLEGLSFISLDCDQGRMLDESLQSFYGDVLWFPPHTIEDPVLHRETTVITGARYMKETSIYKNIGIITVNIPQELFNTIVGRASTLPGSISLLLDNGGNAIAISDESLFRDYGLSVGLLHECIASGQHMVQAGGDTMLLGYTPVGSSGWTLISLNPYEKILETGTDTRNNMLLIMLLVSILFLLTALFISRLLTMRVRFLAARMREVRFDNYSPIPAPAGTDEVSDLTNSYNYMLDKINAYAKSQYQLGLALKNSELKALQAQINPHFLYNTLDLLHWLALDYEANEISEIISLLSKFYKLSLNKGRDMISLRDALLHVEVYVKLQNFRFEHPIGLKLQIPDNIRGCSILNLILQPLVENAILHGILEKESQTGTVTITGSVSENTLYLAIIDDGIGMTQEQLAALSLPPPDKPASTGYGIWNIMERIRLYYGAKYSLTYQSCPGEGTTAYLTIPCLEMKEDSPQDFS